MEYTWYRPQIEWTTSDMIDESLELLYKEDELKIKQPKEPCKIWMIYGWGNNMPSKIHYNKWDAVGEINRLAVENPGETFLLMESTEACKTDPPIVKITLSDYVEPEDK